MAERDRDIRHHYPDRPAGSVLADTEGTMNRAEFDTAIATNDISALIENTFMARVPDLIAGGMSIEAAIIAAKERDDALCLMMIAPEGYWQEEAVKEVKAQMTRRVYERLKALPLVEGTNPHWLECEAALGHPPTAHEFMLWHYTKRGAFPCTSSK